MDEKERERITFSVLSRISRSRFEPAFLKKRLNLKLWRNIEMMHGKKFLDRLLADLQDNKILEPDKKSKVLVVSKKGKKILKRGWVYYETHWYDAEYIRKYSFIISLIALFVSTVGSDNILDFMKYVVSLIYGR